MSQPEHLLAVSRPRFWPYLAGPTLLGIAAGAGDVGVLVSPAALALFAYFLVPANLFLYGINDVFDASLDEGNPKKTDRETRYRGGRGTVIAAVAGALLGLGLLVALPPRTTPWLAGFLFLGAAYSAPPLRLKGRPPLDSLSNGLYVLPGVAGFALAAGEAPPALVLLGGWLWAMGMHTVSAVPDIEPDRQGGIRTTATVLGETRALGYCAVVWLLAAVAVGVVVPTAGVILLLYPALLLAIRLRGIDVARAYWWFPAVNTAVGGLLTIGALWGLLRG